MTIGGIEGVPGAGGNLGAFVNNSYLAQARPNPLTDPRNKIKGGEPWGPKVLLPGEEDPGFQNWKPLLSPGQVSVPLAYSNGSMPMGNAGAVATLNQSMYASTQYGQQLHSNIVKTVYG